MSRKLMRYDEWVSFVTCNSQLKLSDAFSDYTDVDALLRL